MNDERRSQNLLLPITILILYLLILFNIDNLDSYWGDSFIKIHPYVIVISPMIILITIGSSIFRRTNFLKKLLVWAGLYLVGTFLFYANLGIEKDNFITILFDMLMLSISVLISHWLIRNIAFDEMMMKGNPLYAHRFRVLEMKYAEPLIAAEIIRSRRYNYPVTVLAIGFPENLKIKKTFYNRLFRDEGLIPSKYRNKIANILASQARQSDLIAEEVKEGYFLLFCPELATKENTDSVINRINTELERQMKNTFDFGVSTFPNDALTIEVAIEQAKRQICKIHEEKAGKESF